MNGPRAVLSWSTGKDCAWALHLCRRDGLANIEALVTTVNASADRVAMHGTRLSVARAQAKALGLPLIEIALPWPCTNADYEQIMVRATGDIVATGVTAMVFGDLFLEDIRSYREDRLAGSGLTALFPLWGSNTDALSREMVAAGLRARIVTCDPAKLDQSFCGRIYDADFLADLPEGIDPCGENGEFHTAVFDGPMFTDPIPHQLGTVLTRDGFYYADMALD